MRRWMVCLGAVILGLTVASPAAAGGPLAQIHARFDYSMTAAENCGVAVDVVEHDVINILPMHRAPDPDVIGTYTGHISSLMTNPATGKSVLLVSSGPLQQELVSWDPVADEWIQILHLKGMNQLRSPDGGILLGQAGHLAYLQVWDATGTELRSSTLLSSAGQQPDWEAAYCGVIVGALS